MAIGVFVPQIAFRAGQASGAFGAATTTGQTTGLIADTGNRRPLERIVATALDRAVVLAEVRLGELHAAFKRQVIGVFRGDQVTQFQHIILLQSGAGLTVIFDQDAAGARVADVQHQVHRNRFDQAIAVVGDHFQLGDFNFRPGLRLLGG
ncbi:hypothetical protein D3C78_729590 [compost metagenome]